MKVKYFPDTDTAHVEFKDNDVYETKEISENIYIDIDAKGNLVGMTIEHAKANADSHLSPCDNLQTSVEDTESPAPAALTGFWTGAFAR